MEPKFAMENGPIRRMQGGWFYFYFQWMENEHVAGVVKRNIFGPIPAPLARPFEKRRRKPRRDTTQLSLEFNCLHKGQWRRVVLMNLQYAICDLLRESCESFSTLGAIRFTVTVYSRGTGRMSLTLKGRPAIERRNNRWVPLSVANFWDARYRGYFSV